MSGTKTDDGKGSYETWALRQKALRAKMDTLDLHGDPIKSELADTGEIIRRKAHDIGDAAVNAASDARAVTEIKAKFAADSTTSVWNISVSCGQGHVTLSGTVASPDDIGNRIESEAPSCRLESFEQRCEAVVCEHSDMDMRTAARSSPASVDDILTAKWLVTKIMRDGGLLLAHTTAVSPPRDPLHSPNPIDVINHPVND